MTTNTDTIGPIELERLQGWVGRTETLADEVTAAPVCGLRATLDLVTADVAEGMPLPPLWHWLYFLPRHRQGELGPDGHARRGDFLPPVPLPRRMWAGGELQWHGGNPLRVGERVERVSTVESVTRKEGSAGELVFVRVRHEIGNDRGLALTEHHDIVYRGAARPGESAAPVVPVGRPAAWDREIVPDPVLLFRYSALTFNGHRIHYDRSYVTGTEGYPGLIVHGPLLATLLLDLLHRHRSAAEVSRFEFRALRPLFDIHPFRLKGQPDDRSPQVNLWVEDHEGRPAMHASAELR